MSKQRSAQLLSVTNVTNVTHFRVRTLQTANGVSVTHSRVRVSTFFRKRQRIASELSAEGVVADAITDDDQLAILDDFDGFRCWCILNSSACYNGNDCA